MISSNENTENSDNDAVSGFAPIDLSDGREIGNWSTRYTNPIAQKAIKWEKKYLIIVFCSAVFSCFLISILLSIITSEIAFDLINYKKYFYTWIGGTIGGTMFCAKWLIHSVAKNNWNIDRQIWRILTPHLSAGLSLVFIVLLNSEMLNVTSPKSLSIHKCFGIGFLVGYFSDNAIGKLTELAQVFFGSGLGHKK